MTSKFQLPSNSPSLSATSTPQRPYSPPDLDSDSDDLGLDLPYPAELQRSAFLAADFNPQTYLSTLRNRHQTLEDLRSDLRQRSQLLNKELLDLVNGNYEEFLSLGAGLKGGEEKVEGVRVGVLGFGREVGGVRSVVGERLQEVEGLVKEARSVRQDVVFGRGVLELVEQVEELEESLRPGVRGEDGESDEEDGVEEESSAMVVTVKKLRRLSAEFELVQRSWDRNTQKHAAAKETTVKHPILAELMPRIAEIKRLLFLDLSSALKQAEVVEDSNLIMEIMACFSLLGTSVGGSRTSLNG